MDDLKLFIAEFDRIGVLELFVDGCFREQEPPQSEDLRFKDMGIVFVDENLRTRGSSDRVRVAVMVRMAVSYDDIKGYKFIIGHNGEDGARFGAGIDDDSIPCFGVGDNIAICGKVAVDNGLNVHDRVIIAVYKLKKSPQNHF